MGLFADCSRATRTSARARRGRQTAHAYRMVSAAGNWPSGRALLLAARVFAGLRRKKNTEQHRRQAPPHLLLGLHLRHAACAVLAGFLRSSAPAPALALLRR